MFLNNSPVNVQINLEQPVGLISSAFNSVCFITENDTVPERTIEITKLSDVPLNGYFIDSKLYSFCRALFKQKTNVRVFVRNKRNNETYEQAYDADDNSEYYFTVIDSKDISTILNFNDHIQYEMKLQFFSLNQDVSTQIMSRKIVYFYQPYFDDYILYDSGNIVETDNDFFIETTTNSYYTSDGTGFWNFDTPVGTVVDWDDTSNLLLEVQDLTTEQAETIPYKYPEAAWIGACGGLFPSRVQWLWKELIGARVFDLKQIPDLSTTYSIVHKTESTNGSGLTGQEFPIEQQVSLDWVKYAIQKNLWNILYTSRKVSATSNGLLILENGLKEVLDVAVDEGIFSTYQITQRVVDANTAKASFKFTAYLVYSILGVDKVEGVVYQ